MKVLLIDNYDSFTFNIVELLRQLEVESLSILKNDEVTVAKATAFDKIIISPGPATPKESGCILKIIKTLAPTHSILGICLGHQAIAEAFGGSLINLKKPFHGFQSEINVIEKNILFQNLPTSFMVGLYHSWVVEKKNLPNCLLATSFSKAGNIMSLKHISYNVYGIQFHPEKLHDKFW